MLQVNLCPLFKYSSTSTRYRNSAMSYPQGRTCAWAGNRSTLARTYQVDNTAFPQTQIFGESPSTFKRPQSSLQTVTHSMIDMRLWFAGVDQKQVLGAVAKLRKAAINFVMTIGLSVPPSLRPHGTTPFLLDGFPLKSVNNNGYFIWRPVHIFDHISLISS